MIIVTGVLWQNIVDEQSSEDECMHDIHLVVDSAQLDTAT